MFFSFGNYLKTNCCWIHCPAILGPHFSLPDYLPNPLRCLILFLFLDQAVLFWVPWSSPMSETCTCNLTGLSSATVEFFLPTDSSIFYELPCEIPTSKLEKASYRSYVQDLQGFEVKRPL